MNSPEMLRTSKWRVYLFVEEVIALIHQLQFHVHLGQFVVQVVSAALRGSSHRLKMHYLRLRV